MRLRDVAPLGQLVESVEAATRRRFALRASRNYSRYWYRRRARRILRGLSGRYSDEPLFEAFNDAKDRGLLGDMTFQQFFGARGLSWRDRRLEARIRAMEGR